MTLSAEELRTAMRSWATGITVVTARAGAERHGMTVSSFTSVSLDPPTVLVSLEKTSRTHGLLEMSGYFGVIVLAADQAALSDRFAGRHPGLAGRHSGLAGRHSGLAGSPEEQDRFLGLETFELQSGAPFFPGGLAYFDCRVKAAHASGTHTLFIGEVLAVQAGAAQGPLLYYDRAYQRLIPATVE